jgi:hypothetical protein
LLKTIQDDVEEEEDVVKVDCEVPIEDSLSSRFKPSLTEEISINSKTLGSFRNCGVEIGLKLLFVEL